MRVEGKDNNFTCDCPTTSSLSWPESFLKFRVKAVKDIGLFSEIGGIQSPRGRLIGELVLQFVSKFMISNKTNRWF